MMAYQIHYSPESARKYPQVKMKRQIRWSGWFVVVAFLAAALWTQFHGIPDFLIPGDPQVTKTAATSFVANLSNGVKIDDALEVFCETILDGAQY